MNRAQNAEYWVVNARSNSHAWTNEAWIRPGPGEAKGESRLQSIYTDRLKQSV